MKRRFEKKGTYALAASWMRLIRSELRWESSKQFAGMAIRPLGALMGVFVNWKAMRREAMGDVLFPRFDTIFKQVLTSSAYKRDAVKAQTMLCHLRVHDMVNADPEYRCLPELMWRACDKHVNVPQQLRVKFQLKFHFRALLDELPSSDERGALRDYVFGDDEDRAHRKSTGEDLEQSYVGRREEVERGLELFTEYLYRKRAKVEILTSGVISAAMLSSQDAADDLVMKFIGVQQQGKQQ